MKVISQGFVNYAGMVKRSNFTSAKIADKDIVFSVDLNVNRMFLGEGYGIWLANANGNDEIDPLQTEDWYPAKLTTGEMTNGRDCLPKEAVNDNSAYRMDKGGY